MSTEPGATNLNTDTSGFPVRLRRVGRLIATDTGPGSIPGDGLGWTMLRGDAPPSTMAAGWILTAPGAGLRDPTGSGLTTLPRWWPGLEARALALASALVSAADLAGAR